jgi:biopolymer transport protein ExbD
MPKVKVPRKSTAVDMTAMTDVAFLLLTFFILTTQFKPDEPVMVDTPSSVSEDKLMETNMMQVLIDAKGRVFFTCDGPANRIALLEKLGQKYKINFSEDEKKTFSNLQTIGLPVTKLKEYLNWSKSERSSFDKTSAGIPIDSTNNQLGDWVWFARLSNPDYQAVIKGDRETNFPVVKRVFDIFQEKKVNKFNFVTNLEKRPTV